jgi:hypothetical protein
MSGNASARQLVAASFLTTSARAFLFQLGFLPLQFWRGLPEMVFEIDAGFDNSYTFALEEFSLQGSVRFADENFPALTDYTMPGNAFSGGSCGHRTARRARAAGQAQSLSEGSIS